MTSHCSSYVGITVTRYVLDDGGSNPDNGKKKLAFTTFGPTLEPTLPPIQCLLTLPGEKQPEREGHSTPSSAEFKNEWNYISTPLYAFVVWTGTAPSSPFTATHIISASFRISQNTLFLTFWRRNFSSILAHLYIKYE